MSDLVPRTPQSVRDAWLSRWESGGRKECMAHERAFRDGRLPCDVDGCPNAAQHHSPYFREGQYICNDHARPYLGDALWAYYRDNPPGPPRNEDGLP